MTARYLVADVFDGLATLDDGSVDLVITSPPFLGLRSYLPADHPLKHKEIGLEPTPAAFLDVALAYTAELRRVLAPHGSLCVEFGDTYAGSGGAGGDYAEDGLREGQPRFRQGYDRRDGRKTMQQDDYGASLPPPVRAREGWPLAKSKTLIPELYRIALAYGINPLTGQPSPAGRWRVRNVVTWARPNPPVGALGDKRRPATSDVVIACTSDKRYWDDIATRQQISESTVSRLASGAPNSLQRPINNSEAPERSPYTGSHPSGAPLLDWWAISPGGYPGSHYAVFPPALVEPLIKAMAPPKVCRTCGEPTRRIVETTYEPHGDPAKHNAEPKARADYALQQRTENAQGMANGRASRIDSTVGWTDCGHDDWRPALVLDPFGGSGTVGQVATGHGHDCILIDLDERNAVLAEQRIGPFLFERVNLEQASNL